MHSNSNATWAFGTQDDLVSRLRAGEESVLEDIQQGLGPAMCARLSRKYGGLLAPDRIEHVLNVALEHLWLHRHRFDEAKGTLSGWFWRISENVARDMLRSGWCQGMLRECSLADLSVLGWIEEFAEDHGGENGEETVGIEMKIRNERLRVVCESLEQLSERRRIVLEMELITAKLAEELGISPSTVRAHRKQVLDILRNALEQ